MLRTMLQYSEFIQFVSFCKNYLAQCNIQKSLKIMCCESHSSDRTWSFHIVVFRRTAKIFTKNYNTQPCHCIVCLVNLYFSDDVFAIEVF